MNIIIYVGMDVHSTSYTLCCYTIENEKILSRCPQALELKLNKEKSDFPKIYS